MDHSETIQRLKSVEGHIRGIQRMLEEDKYCIDVIGQIQAVQAALDKVSAQLLDRHLHACVTTAIRGNDPDEREKVLAEISSVFQTTNKL